MSEIPPSQDASPDNLQLDHVMCPVLHEALLKSILHHRFDSLIAAGRTVDEALEATQHQYRLEKAYFLHKLATTGRESGAITPPAFLLPLQQPDCMVGVV